MSHKTCIKMLNVVNPHFPDSTPNPLDIFNEGIVRKVHFLSHPPIAHSLVWVFLVKFLRG